MDEANFSEEDYFSEDDPENGDLDPFAKRIVEEKKSSEPSKKGKVSESGIKFKSKSKPEPKNPKESRRQKKIAQAQTPSMAQAQAPSMAQAQPTLPKIADVTILPNPDSFIIGSQKHASLSTDSLEVTAQKNVRDEPFFSSNRQLYSATSEYPFGLSSNSATCVVMYDIDNPDFVEVIICSSRESSPYYLYKLAKMVAADFWFYKTIYWDSKDIRRNFYFIVTIDTPDVPSSRYGKHRDSMVISNLPPSQREALRLFLKNNHLLLDEIPELRERDDEGYKYDTDRTATIGFIEYANFQLIAATTMSRLGKDFLPIIQAQSREARSFAFYLNLLIHHTTPREEEFELKKIIAEKGVTDPTYIEPLSRIAYQKIQNILTILKDTGKIVSDFIRGIIIDTVVTEIISSPPQTQASVDSYLIATPENIEKYNQIVVEAEHAERKLRRVLMLQYQDNSEIKARLLELVQFFMNDNNTKIIFNYGEELEELARKGFNIPADKIRDTYMSDSKTFTKRSLNPQFQDEYLDPDEQNLPGNKRYINHTCMLTAKFRMDAIAPQILSINPKDQIIELPIRGGRSKRNKSRRRNTKKKLNKLRKMRSSQRKQNKKRRSRKR